MLGKFDDCFSGHLDPRASGNVVHHDWKLRLVSHGGKVGLHSPLVWLIVRWNNDQGVVNPRNRSNLIGKGNRFSSVITSRPGDYRNPARDHFTELLV